jgi:hypothetical protein
MESPQELNGENPPDLRGTVIVAGHVNGTEVSTWSGIVRNCIRIAIERKIPIEEIRTITVMNMVASRCKERGFVPLSTQGPSVQYADANKSWAGARRLAERMGLSVSVRFRWKKSFRTKGGKEDAVLTIRGK